MVLQATNEVNGINTEALDMLSDISYLFMAWLVYLIYSCHLIQFIFTFLTYHLQYYKDNLYYQIEPSKPN